jgi:hypothetical protein
MEPDDYYEAALYQQELEERAQLEHIEHGEK